MKRRKMFFRKSNKLSGNGFIFAVGFGVIGAAIIATIGAVDATRKVEAENTIISNGVSVASDVNASAGKYVAFNGTEPSVPITQTCNTNRTIKVTDENTSGIGYKVVKRTPSATELRSINTKIKNEIDAFIAREIDRNRIIIRDGKYYLTQDTSKVFVPYKTLIGSLGIVQTSTAIAADPGWSVKRGNYEGEAVLGRFDPIVGPCSAVFGHEHVFFGNTGIDGYSTSARSLFNKRTTINPMDAEYLNKTFEGEWIGDTAAYWMPTLYKNGRRLKVENITFYYFPTGKSQSPEVMKTIKPYPLGLRMIVGDANNKTGKMGCRVYYMQMDNDANNTCNSSSMVNTNGKKLEFSMNYPSCWDGKHLSTPDQSHMAYPTGDKKALTGSNIIKCPITHPIAVPQLTMIGNFGEGVNGTDNVTLSSGDWTTLHADFFNVWDPTLLNTLVVETMNKGISAGGIEAALPGQL